MTWAAVLVTAWATIATAATFACGYWLSGTHHTKPPAPGPQPPAVATAPANPAPGHCPPSHRGHHMVIDVWECGSIYTWTRATGWAHDTTCIDEELRRLFS
jgi:hypothetical protein